MIPKEAIETVALERASSLGALTLFIVHFDTALAHCLNQILISNAYP